MLKREYSLLGINTHQLPFFWQGVYQPNISFKFEENVLYLQTIGPIIRATVGSMKYQHMSSSVSLDRGGGRAPLAGRASLELSKVFPLSRRSLLLFKPAHRAPNRSPPITVWARSQPVRPHQYRNQASKGPSGLAMATRGDLKDLGQFRCLLALSPSSPLGTHQFIDQPPHVSLPPRGHANS